MRKLTGLAVGIGIILVAIGIVGINNFQNPYSANLICDKCVGVNSLFVSNVKLSEDVIRAGEPFEITLTMENKNHQNYKGEEWRIKPHIYSDQEIEFIQKQTSNFLLVPPGEKIEIIWTTTLEKTERSTISIMGIYKFGRWQVDVIPVNTFGLSVTVARNLLYASLLIGIVLLFPVVSVVWAWLNPTVIGLIAGIIGAALGFLPFAYWHEFAGSRVNELPGDTSSILFILAYGLPLPMVAVFVVLPIGGAIMGVIGVKIGLKRHLNKNGNPDRVKTVAVWWGLIFGFLFNLFVGFFSQ